MSKFTEEVLFGMDIFRYIPIMTNQNNSKLIVLTILTVAKQLVEAVHAFQSSCYHTIFFHI